MSEVLLGTYHDYLASLDGSGKPKPPRVLRTLSWRLNYLLGLPGMPLEKPIEIYGPPHAGKTTLSNYLTMVAQKRIKKPAVVIDVEGKYDLSYAKMCGVDISKNMFRHYHTEDAIKKPLYGEIALQLAVDAVLSRKFSSVTLDSIGGLTFKAIAEGKVTDAHMGVEARIITRFMKKLALISNNSGTLILLLNQKRANYGYGSDETSSGGWAMKHYASARFRVGRGKEIKYREDPVGYYMNITCHKNGFGEPYRTSQVPLIYYKGVYPPVELLLAAKEFGFVEGRYSYEGKSLGRGIIDSSRALWKHPERKKLIGLVSKAAIKKENSRKIKVIG